MASSVGHTLNYLSCSKYATGLLDGSNYYISALVTGSSRQRTSLYATIIPSFEHFNKEVTGIKQKEQQPETAEKHTDSQNTLNRQF